MNHPWYSLISLNRAVISHQEDGLSAREQNSGHSSHREGINCDCHQPSFSERAERQKMKVNSEMSARSGEVRAGKLPGSSWWPVFCPQKYTAQSWFKRWLCAGHKSLQWEEAPAEHRQRQSESWDWQLESGRAHTDMCLHLFRAAGWLVLPWDTFLTFYLQLDAGHTRKELKRLICAPWVLDMIALINPCSIPFV